MTAAPVTVTLVADAAQTVTVDGLWGRLKVIPAVSGAAVFTVSPAGTATKGTAGEYVSTHAEPQVVPAFSSNGTTTTISLISSTAGLVTVRPCGYDED